MNVFSKIYENVEQGDYFYHGSNAKIKKFELQYDQIQKTLQYGLGIYFTNKMEDASSYGKYLYTVEANLNPSRALPNNGRPKKSDLLDMIRYAKLLDREEYDISISNMDEDENVAIKEYVGNYLVNNPIESYTILSSDFYRKHPVEFCESLVSLGYDYFLTQRQAFSAKHLVVYNPKIINIVDGDYY